MSVKRRRRDQQDPTRPEKEPRGEKEESSGDDAAAATARMGLDDALRHGCALESTREELTCGSSAPLDVDAFRLPFFESSSAGGGIGRMERCTIVGTGGGALDPDAGACTGMLSSAWTKQRESEQYSKLEGIRTREGVVIV
jgi:hypothetical protein